MAECDTKKSDADLQSTDGQVELDTSGGTFYCLTVIGQIEGHFALDQNQKATK